MLSPLLHCLLIFKNVCPSNQSHVVRPKKVMQCNQHTEIRRKTKSLKISDNDLFMMAKSVLVVMCHVVRLLKKMIFLN